MTIYKVSDIILFLMILLATSHEYVYYWKYEARWNLASNWDLGRVPCYKDNIRFPQNPPLPVDIFIDSNISVKELNLPYNGVLRLYDNINIMTSDGDINNNNCSAGGEIQLKEQRQHNWHDTSNWCSGFSDTFFDKVCEESETVLHFTHVQRIPCLNSFILLFDYTDLNFIFEPNTHVEIGSIWRLSHWNYHIDILKSNEEVLDYLKIPQSQNRYDIASTSSVKFHHKSCLFCPCKSNVERKKLICSYIQCPTLPCKDPFQPYDHCCPVCGLSVVIEVLDKCKHNSLDYDIAQNIKNIPGVMSTLIAERNDSVVEYVLVDKTPNGSAMDTLKNNLAKIIELVQKFGKRWSCNMTVHNTSTSDGQQQSQNPSTPSSSSSSSSSSPSLSTSSKSSVGWGISIFCIILIIIVVILLAFTMRHKIQRQFIPSIRQTLVNLGSRSPYSNFERNGRGRGVVFDNSIVFDGSLSSVGGGDASFVIPDTSSEARLVENDFLNNTGQASGAGTSSGFGAIMANVGRKVKSKIESVNPRTLFSSLESNESESFDPSDFKKSRKKRSNEGTESAQSDFDFNNPVYNRQRNELM